MKRSSKRTRTPRTDYRASWAPVIAAANARLAREELTTTNAFGTYKVERFVWCEQMGVSYQVGTGFNQRTFCADLNWVEAFAGLKMAKVVA